MMQTRCATSWIAGFGVWLAIALPSAAETTGARLSVCLDADNPPFSSSSAGGGGFDADLARVIARKLQREVDFVWVKIPARGGLGKALNESIQAGRCDLYVGLPVGEETDSDLAGRLLTRTRPYVALGYVLVSPPGTTPMSVSQARRARRVGAVTATPADLYLYKEKFDRVPCGNNRELVAAVRAGGVQAALIWGPALAAVRGDGADAIVMAREQPADSLLRTNMVIAVRISDRELASSVDAAVAQLIADGEMRAMTSRYGLPWLEIN
ncbi:MAG: transporter substrate-binding domain-containing protein [Candidatus Methylophosphatis roskildensis]